MEHLVTLLCVLIFFFFKVATQIQKASLLAEVGTGIEIPEHSHKLAAWSKWEMILFEKA